jgi:hypothetical protein
MAGPHFLTALQPLIAHTLAGVELVVDVKTAESAEPILCARIPVDAIVSSLNDEDQGNDALKVRVEGTNGDLFDLVATLREGGGL